MLRRVADHMVLLQRLAETPGPIMCNGSRMSKWKAIAIECVSARASILVHLNEPE